MDHSNYPNEGMPPNRIPSSYQLSREEKRVLKECSSESFYRRCVPLMTTLGLGTYYCVQLGYLKGNPNYGAVPKVSIGVLLGFIAGKLSYKSQCEEKILALPGGRLKESVLIARKSSDTLWGRSSGLYNDPSLSYTLPTYGSSALGSLNSNLTSELDQERHLDSFDDSFKIRAELQEDLGQALPTSPPARSVSYDELRNRNREEHELRRKPLRPIDNYPPSYGRSYSGPQSSGSYSTPLSDGPHSAYPTAQPTDQFNSIATDPSVRTEYRTTFDQPVKNYPRISGQRTNLYGDSIERSE